MNWQKDAEAAAKEAAKNQNAMVGPFIQLVNGQSAAVNEGITPGSWILNVGKDTPSIVIAAASGKAGAKAKFGLGPVRPKAAFFRDGAVTSQSYNFGDEVYRTIEEQKANKVTGACIGPEVMCYIPQQGNMEQDMYGILWFKNSFINSFPGSSGIGKILEFNSHLVETKKSKWWVPCDPGTQVVVANSLPEAANEEFSKKAPLFLNPGGGELAALPEGTPNMDI